MSEDERSSLELFLRRKAQDEMPVRVLSIQKQENVIVKGENYLSNIENWKVRVTLGSGNQKVLSYIVKNEHQTEPLSTISRDMGVFVREITMYRDILPKMEQLLESIDNMEEIPWPRCVGVKLYSQLILEDLRAQGYRMMARKKQLGLDAATLVVRQLGKFHALSRVLLIRGEIPAALYEKHCWYYKRTFFEGMMNENAARLLAVMQKWGDEWVDASNRFKNITPYFATSYLKGLSFEPNEFTVLSHGDCWTNNMLFRYDGDQERPFAVKFIDFQLPFVSAPARDLIYFLTSSVRFDVRVQQTDLLLDAYCDSLSSYLTKLGYKGNIPFKGDVEEMIRKRTILELGESIMLLPIILGESLTGPALDNIVRGNVEASSKGKKTPDTFNILATVGEPVESMIKFALRKAMNQGLF